MLSARATWTSTGHTRLAIVSLIHPVTVRVQIDRFLSASPVPLLSFDRAAAELTDEQHEPV